MADKKETLPKGKPKLSRLVVPAGLAAFGMLLSRLVPEGAGVAQTIIELDMSQGNIRAAVGELIMAIDRELGKVKNAEHRQLLVDFAYRLKDLSVREQLREMTNCTTPGTKG